MKNLMLFWENFLKKKPSFLLPRTRFSLLFLIMFLFCFSPFYPIKDNIFPCVKVSHSGNLLSTHEITRVDPHASAETGFAGLLSGDEYTFQVMAFNRDEASSWSAPLAFTLRNEIANIKVEETTESSIRLSWSPLDNVTGYYVIFTSSDNELDAGTNVNTTTMELELAGLAPSTQYTISVAGISDSGLTLPKVTTARTTGQALPQPHLIKTGAATLPDSATSVKLTWSIPVSNTDPTPHTYDTAVWYGTNMQELIKAGPRNIFKKTTHGTINNLDACTEYLFAVALIASNNQSNARGIGPMSNILKVGTDYSPLAAPRNVRLEKENVLVWSAPCSQMKEPVSYIIQVKDLTTGTLTPTTLAPVQNQSIVHTFSNLLSGAIYSVQVRQKVKNALSSPAVEMRGPEIRPPTSVYATWENKSITVHWGYIKQASQYSVLISPHRNITAGCHGMCALCMPAKTSPLRVSDVLAPFQQAGCEVPEEFFVAVSTVMVHKEHQYTSAWARSVNTFISMADHHKGTLLKLYFQDVFSIFIASSDINEKKNCNLF